MSIDDATPEEWNRASAKVAKMAREEAIELSTSEYEKEMKLKKAYADTYGQHYDLRTPDMDEMVERPPHYNYGNIECIEAIEESMTPEAFKGYLKGNALKYLWRYERKGNALQDAKKAQWYISRLISTYDE